MLVKGAPVCNIRVCEGLIDINKTSSCYVSWSFKSMTILLFYLAIVAANNNSDIKAPQSSALVVCEVTERLPDSKQ